MPTWPSVFQAPAGPDCEPSADGVPSGRVRAYPVPVSEANYVSGEDYVVEFLGYRFGFNAVDFEQRVNAAAVRLGLVETGELDDGEVRTWSS